MINVKEQQDLLLNISRKLKKKITAYAVGGTAMMFHAIKDSTKDIDLVFNDKKERGIFEEAAKSIGYKEFDPIAVYGAEKENHPIMLARRKGEAERFDLFTDNVISFFFSEDMKKRAENAVEFGGKLILKIADVHDLILMKCATDRQRDAEDVKAIIETQKIDWSILIEEAKNQIRLGKERAAFDLGSFLEGLKKGLKEKIPNKVLDALFGIVKEQAEKKQNKNNP